MQLIASDDMPLYVFIFIIRTLKVNDVKIEFTELDQSLRDYCRLQR